MASSSRSETRALLVTGANGFIGSRLAALALGRGLRVRSITRSEWTGPPAIPVEGRFLGSLPNRIPPQALDGVDVVAHCAGTGEPGERLARAVNVEGTIRLAEVARSAGVETFVYLSSQSAVPDATSAYGRTKLEAERLLLDMVGIRVVILRPGLVTGPGARGLFQRMTRTVEWLPVVPLLGGGRAIVQPIHVDDLCAAILRSDELAEELDHRVLCLGDPHGVTLADLVEEISLERRGRRSRTVPLPIGPVEVLVRSAESLHVPLPVNSNNLKGLSGVERMDTAADMALLGVPVRPVREALGLVGVAAPETAPGDAGHAVDGPARILLVGAGRVGLVHAVTLTRLSGAVLSGLVDRSSQAIAFLQRIGVRAPGFSSVHDAVVADPRGERPDAAVIATPPATHLDLARESVELGLALMVEKPLAVKKEELEDFERLAQLSPAVRIQVGYLMPQIPQVAEMLARLKRGELGAVLGFEGFTLLSFVEGPLEGRWEVDPKVAGGGALINAGGHVLSLIVEAFGAPQGVEARSLRIHSEHVEDSIVADLDYGTFRGRHHCSWSMGGFPRQENVLRVRTDRGELSISGGLATFLADDGDLEVLHGLDVDVGFNLAPDYVGAGFSTELGALRDAARGGAPGPMNVGRAAAIERVLFGIYDVAEDVPAFEERASAWSGVTAEPRLAASEVAEPAAVRRILDLRGVATVSVAAFLAEPGHADAWEGFEIYPEQLDAVPGELRTGERLSFSVPDFITQGRLLSLGRRREVAQALGARGVLGAVRTAAPQVLRDRSATFWAGAFGLLGGALRGVPRGFRGAVLLHASVCDLALALRRYDMLERMLVVCRRAHPRARIGLHTNLASEAADALCLMEAEVDEISILVSPNTTDHDVVSELRAAVAARVRLVSEVGAAPALVQRAAAIGPHAWARGADAVLIGAAADGFLRSRIAVDRARAWSEAFPGLAAPEDIPC
jgi:predicted dehydrogenase/nucleoside-diphosphate-sugar epimerase